ncbi:MAG: hypothetical protein WEA84_00805 [Rhodovibrionaceae bacterium]
MTVGKHSESLSALCQAYWFWRYFDEIELKRLQKVDNKHDADSVSRIGNIYSVSRSLPKAKREKVADCINELAGKFPGKTLTERAQLCLDAARSINSKKLPRSGVSKLVWFVAPSDWTMFDSYAHKGVGIGYARADNFS